ncbi:MAG: TAXI family TRAP transporter solute-binding subunit [Desulfohalobiaceae bacterium]
MLRKFLATTLALALVVCFAMPQQSADAAERRFVSIAAGWVTGAYYPMAGAISRVAFNNLKDENIKVTAESSGASVANANLIASANTDFAILQNDIAFHAYNGKEGMFDEKVENLRGVAVLYPEHIQCIVRDGSGIDSVADLKGKRVAVGPVGSGTTENVKQIISAWDMTLDDFKAEQLQARQASNYLKDGRLDAAFFTVAVGAAAIKDIATVIDIEVLDITGPNAQKLLEEVPFYTQQPVPAGSYPGQDEDAKTVSVMAILAARADLDQDIVYKIMKAMYENIDKIHSAHSKFKNVSTDVAMDGMTIPLHPGAEKYLKEVGVVD